jgi:peptide deformylase
MDGRYSLTFALYRMMRHMCVVLCAYTLDPSLPVTILSDNKERDKHLVRINPKIGLELLIYVGKK